MKDAELYFFLSVLSDFIHKRKTIVKNSIEWKKIIDYARIHQVEGIIYYQCKEYLDEENVILREKYAHTLYYSTNLEYVLKDIKDLFAENHISFIFFKGSEIRSLYPIPQLRTMGDIDILIHTRDLKRAAELLSSDNGLLDYDGKELQIRYKGILIELHDQLFFESATSTKQIIEYGEKCWKNIGCVNNSYHFSLSPEYHFVYMLLHIRIHILQSGIGFRQFMDLAIMLNSYKLNWEYVASEMKLFHLEHFLRVCINLCHYWFEVPIPELFKEIDLDTMSAITEKMSQDGVFGFENDENKTNYIIQEINNHGKKWLFKSRLNSLFLPYNQMVKKRRYHYLKNMKWLLPYAWADRII